MEAPTTKEQPAQTVETRRTVTREDVRKMRPEQPSSDNDSNENEGSNDN